MNDPNAFFSNMLRNFVFIIESYPLRSECHLVAIPKNIEGEVRACSSCVKSQFRIKCVFLCLYKKVPFINHNFC